LQFTDKARRIAGRRCEEQTSVFRERYARRSGIESTNSGLKNRLTMGRLRVRGRGAVFRTIILKVAGWNVLRASASEKLRAMVQEKLTQLLGAGWAWLFGQAQITKFSLLCRIERSTTLAKRLQIAFSRFSISFSIPRSLTA